MSPSQFLSEKPWNQLELTNQLLRRWPTGLKTFSTCVATAAVAGARTHTTTSKYGRTSTRESATRYPRAKNKKNQRKRKGILSYSLIMKTASSKKGNPKMAVLQKARRKKRKSQRRTMMSRWSPSRGRGLRVRRTCKWKRSSRKRSCLFHQNVKVVCHPKFQNLQSSQKKKRPLPKWLEMQWKKVRTEK